jgi:hypothetical protein
MGITASSLIHKQPITVEIHSRPDEEPTTVKIPELTDGIKEDSGSPCFVVRSGERHVF